MSNEFYTSVENKGNTMFVRGYREGKPFFEKTSYSPSLYFKSNLDNDAKTLSGFPLKRRTYDNIYAAKAALKSIGDVHGLETYGTSDWRMAFIRERFEGMTPDTSLVRPWFWDIETRVDGVTLMPNDTIRIRHDGEEAELFAHQLFDIPKPFTVYCPVADDFVPVAKASFAARGFPSQDVADREILLVTFYDARSDKITIFSRKPVLESNPIFEQYPGKIDFKAFSSEKEMLIDIVKFFATNRMDFLLAWNANFDIGFLYNRIKNFMGEGYADKLSPFGYIDISTKTNENGDVDTTYSIPGISSMDYLEMYKKFNPGSKENFTLAFIAEHELGEGVSKVDMPGETFKEKYDGSGDVFSPPEEGDKFFDFNMKKYNRTLLKAKLAEGEDVADEIARLDEELEVEAFNRFVHYNVVDTMLIKMIDDKQKLVDLVMMIAYDSMTNFDSTLSSMMTWESIIYNHFVDIGVRPSTNPSRGQRRSIPGAYVMHPTPGKYGWTLSVDATALYPSIMMQNNISPDTKIEKLDGVSPATLLNGVIPEFDRDTYILSANGLLTEKGKTGFIPFLIKRKFDQRKEFKKYMLNCAIEAQEMRDSSGPIDEAKLELLDRKVAEYDVKQKAVKVIANSGYGVQAAKFFSYYDPDLAEAITLTGQYSLKLAKIAVDSYINKALKTTGVDYVVYMDTDSVVGDSKIRINGEEVRIDEFFENCSFSKMDKLGEDNYVKHVSDSGYSTKCFDGNSVLNKSVRYVMAHKVKKEMFKVTVGGKSVTITADHSLIVRRNGEIVSIKPKDVIRGDKLIHIMGISVGEEVTTDESEDFVIESLGVCEEWVYDIEVDDIHNFFANDILVHNSLYFHAQKIVDGFCVGKSDKEIVDFLENFVTKIIQPVINGALTKEMSKLGVDKCELFYKLECIGPSAVWTAPKKYAFDILYSEGIRYEHAKTKVMGIEIVRSSTPAVIKPYLKKCIQLILSGTESELQEYIIETKKMFFGQIYQNIAFPRGVNGLSKYANEASIYQKGNGLSTPIAVRAALLHNHHIKKMGIDDRYPPIGEGEKCRYIYLKVPNPIHENVIAFSAKIPREFGLEKYVDVNTQWQKTFISPLDKLLVAVGWSAEPKNTAFDDCW